MRRGHAAAAALVLAACNQLEGIGEPTLVPDADPALPGCATGWTHRAPIALQNASTAALAAYQVELHLNTAAWIAAGELRADGADLRFATAADDSLLPYAIESGLGTADTVVWVEVPAIPVGASTLFAYGGNPAAAAPTTGSPFVQGAIENSSFEQVGAWTVGTSVGTPAEFTIADRDWHSDGSASLLVDLEVPMGGLRSTEAVSAIYQPVTFPDSSEYVLRFDADIIAATHGGSDGVNDGEFAISLGDVTDDESPFQIWYITGDSANITGLQLDLETAPFAPGPAPLSVVARVRVGDNYGYAKGYFDNFRIRKHADPEPTAAIGSMQPLCTM